MTQAERSALGLFRLVVLVAALAAAGAGAIHFLAVDAHRSHALMAVFFVATALAQIGWAAALLVAPSRPILLAGIAGNAAVIGTWVLSRTTGLPFVPGAEHAEPLGVRDVVATLLEGTAVGAAGLAVLLPASAAAVALPAGRRAVAVTAAAVLAVTGSAALAGPGHVHGAEAHAHGDKGHHAEDRHGHKAGRDHQHGHEPGGGARHQHGDGTGHGHGDGTGHGDAAGDHGTGNHDHDDGTGHTGNHSDHNGDNDNHGDSHGDHGDNHGDQHGDHDNHAVPDDFPDPEFWGEKTTMRVGPFLLPPSRMGGEAHLNRPGIIPSQPCRNCYITGIEPRLVYGDGSPADLGNGAMLHHTVLMDTGRNDPTCERFNGVGLLGRRIFAAGNERTPISLPRGYGFQTSGAPLAYIAEIMNHSNRFKTVYLEADIYHVPASRPGMKPVVPIWLDVANCGLSEYDVPSGRSTETWGWPSKFTGRVVAAGGHVHAGGVGIVLRNAATGRRMCTSEAAYGTSGAFEGQVTDMSTCSWDSLGAVRRGQQLEISSIYDTSQPLQRIMGILMLALYETDDLRGASPPPAWMRRDPDTVPPDSGHQHDH
ncbi:hypothetical protein D0Z08_06390 [Nocardioides immobilis]|uniref:Uncharacterized protein n=1 Tax=Nocardioides immobilis TaxID=2049295 RepID=A0A417Y5U0_9ACTN|nr:hypothetical protein [Nocardioides immobilis]RHW27916.1 hypothetical protein D0Z08_06390 [Nocardioides immobilis]